MLLSITTSCSARTTRISTLIMSSITKPLFCKKGTLQWVLWKMYFLFKGTGDGCERRTLDQRWFCSKMKRISAESSFDIGTSFNMFRRIKKLLSFPHLHQFSHIHENRVIRDTLRLAHGMIHDDDRVIFLKIFREIFNGLDSCRVQC